MRGMKLGKPLHTAIRVAAALFLLYLLVLVVSSYWLPITALAWRLRHGSTVQVGDYSVPVPTWWLPEQSKDSTSLRFHFRAHNLTGGYTFGDITFQVGKTHSAEQFKQGMEAARRSTRPGAGTLAQMISPTKETTVNIAGQPSVCFEFLLSVECLPENQDYGLTADLKGTSGFAPLFYQTLSKVTRTGTSQK